MGCSSSSQNAATGGRIHRTHSGHNKDFIEDELTEVDVEQMKEEMRKRQEQEDEITRLIYEEKEALRQISSRLIERPASCESLMDNLDDKELLEISIDETPYRAQKRARRKVMKHNLHQTGTRPWMLYNNVDGIAEPHMVHLALFMQRVLSVMANRSVNSSPVLRRGSDATSSISGNDTTGTVAGGGGGLLKLVTPPSSPVESPSQKIRSRKQIKTGGLAAGTANSMGAGLIAIGTPGSDRSGGDEEEDEEEGSEYGFRSSLAARLSMMSARDEEELHSVRAAEVTSDLEGVDILTGMSGKMTKGSNTTVVGTGNDNDNNGEEGVNVSDGNMESANGHTGTEKCKRPASVKFADTSNNSNNSNSDNSNSSHRDVTATGTANDEQGDKVWSLSSRPSSISFSRSRAASLHGGAGGSSMGMGMSMGLIPEAADPSLNGGRTGGIPAANSNVASVFGSEAGAAIGASNSNVEGVFGGDQYQQLVAAISPEFLQKYRHELLSLKICMIAPPSSYEITPENLYDFDLPPGLVTMRVAKTVMDLYRRGGRLTPKSVHKLLRLGFRSLRKKDNITHIHMAPEDKLTLVGDLHGQLGDLLHIVDRSGMPGPNNRYIFNGDFVDRGEFGVEVMLTLLALHIAAPDQVVLNRGNHEDFAICTVYGFQLECYEKYGEVIFGMFVEVFQKLPLFAVINHSVFVLHGGLFHTPHVSLAELNTIDRSTFSLQDMPEGGETLLPMPREDKQAFLQQLNRAALWSDPADELGIMESVRGAGVSFGPDITRYFLNHNQLHFIVRSHECVRSGYDEPYSGEDRGLLCTIFSASDYGASGNSGAYLVFKLDDATSLTNKQSADYMLQAQGTTPGGRFGRESFGGCSSSDDSGAASPAAASAESRALSAAPEILNQDSFPDLNDANDAAGGLGLSATSALGAGGGLLREDEKQLSVEERGLIAAVASADSDSDPLSNSNSNSNSDSNNNNNNNRHTHTHLNHRQELADGEGVSEIKRVVDLEGKETNLTYVVHYYHSSVLRRAATSAMQIDEAATTIDLTTLADNDSSNSSNISKNDNNNNNNSNNDPPAESSSLLAKSNSGEDDYGMLSYVASTESLSDVAAAAVDGKRGTAATGTSSGASAGLGTVASSPPGRGGLTPEAASAAREALAFDSDKDCVLIGSRSTLNEFIVRRREELLAAFRVKDKKATGVVSKFQWCDVMREVMTLHIRWISVMQILVLDQHFRIYKGKKMVDYNAFLSTFEDDDEEAFDVSGVQDNGGGGGGAGDDGGESSKSITAVSMEDVDVHIDDDGGESSPKSKAAKVKEAMEKSNSAVDAMLNASTPKSNHSSVAAVDGGSRKLASVSSLSGNGNIVLASMDSLGRTPPGPQKISPQEWYCGHQISSELVSLMYVDFELVEAAFKFFDQNQDGFITKEEFRKACKELNKSLSKNQQIQDIEEIRMLMDIEENGEIPFNIFFELFRLSEMKLNVGIDEEDTLVSSLHHYAMKDIVRHHSQMNISSSLAAMGISMQDMSPQQLIQLHEQMQQQGLEPSPAAIYMHEAGASEDDGAGGYGNGAGGGGDGGEGEGATGSLISRSTSHQHLLEIHGVPINVDSELASVSMDHTNRNSMSASDVAIDI